MSISTVKNNNLGCTKQNIAPCAPSSIPAPDVFDNKKSALRLDDGQSGHYFGEFHSNKKSATQIFTKFVNVTEIEGRYIRRGMTLQAIIPGPCLRKCQYLNSFVCLEVYKLEALRELRDSQPNLQARRQFSPYTSLTSQFRKSRHTPCKLSLLIAVKLQASIKEPSFAGQRVYFKQNAWDIT